MSDYRTRGHICRSDERFGCTCADHGAALRAVDALTADLAAANATIAAQGLALATLREALELREFDDGTWAVGVRVSHYTFVRNLLAQPADDAAALAGAVLEAADRMAEVLDLMVNDPETGASRRPDTDDWAPDAVALDAYRRARAALRGGGAVEAGPQT